LDSLSANTRTWHLRVMMDLKEGWRIPIYYDLYDCKIFIDFWPQTHAADRNSADWIGGDRRSMIIEYFRNPNYTRFLPVLPIKSWSCFGVVFMIPHLCGISSSILQFWGTPLYWESELELLFSFGRWVFLQIARTKKTFNGKKRFRTSRLEKEIKLKWQRNSYLSRLANSDL